MSLILIKRKNHKNIILLTEEEYESTKETLYLLSNLGLMRIE
ncbi:MULTISPECIES: type II toxin-antitoxin system Phd/YefM family antitoxin [spotted fever group]|uniref:Antitoxin n=1 Tax=Rickettsia parkeri str. Tate's Hell TaxID=1359189 RepID=A0ABR5DQ51_RICPA|nr:type II toxin-antitoxin system Phd/YefM family antitoxin [Rickettsia sibirica]KJV96547.1 antitoxin, type II toxin-antitoxin system family protein [Rickettsia parkeri str. AT\